MCKVEQALLLIFSKKTFNMRWRNSTMKRTVANHLKKRSKKCLVNSSIAYTKMVLLTLIFQN